MAPAALPHGTAQDRLASQSGLHGLGRVAVSQPPQLQPCSGTSTAVNIDDFLSEEAKLRTYPSLRSIITQYAGMEGVLGMHGGLPPASSFPFASITIQTKDGQQLSLTDPAKVTAAQQYSLHPKGYSGLYDWVKAHVARQHAPPCAYDVLITNGNNHTLEMTMAALLNKGDSVLCEEYTYPNTIESIFIPRGFHMVPVAVDEQGLVPAALEQALVHAQGSGRAMPRVLYTIPVGQNPTGAVAGRERKQQIYAICHCWNIFIVEDDPYYYLQFDLADGSVPGLAGLAASYLALDTDGRVARLDSFSKFLAPGLRLGWVTAQPALVEKLLQALHAATLGPCSMTQVMTAELLGSWGPAGLEAHISTMQQEYMRRAGALQAAAQRQLAGLATWATPSAGMFVWLHLTAVADADAVVDLLREARVVVVPGRIAHVTGPRPAFDVPYIRLSYSTIPEQDIEEAVARLGRALRAVQQQLAAPCSTGA